jgi:hypothetical protein
MFNKIILALAVLTSVMFAVASPATAMPVGAVDGASVPHVENIYWHHRWHHWHHWHRHW